jgi:riboflavin synthase
LRVYKKDHILFTGIVEATGKIESLTKTGGDYRVIVNTGKLDLSDVKLGDSIATNGVCLTVVELYSTGFAADVSNETISNTGFKSYQNGQVVNLEKAMLPTTRFGGHIVSGHVDGIGSVTSIYDNGRAKDIWVQCNSDLSKYIVKKGSVTIDGVSLTVNEVSHDQFKLTIVPHTALQTTIESLVSGSNVNVEIDILARYVERLMTHNNNEGVTMSLLSRSGFIK